MPRSVTSSYDTRSSDKASTKTSPTKKQGRSRSRNRVETGMKDDSSRASSPSRGRGRPPSTGRGRSRSPSRATKTAVVKSEAAPSTRRSQNSTGAGQTEASTLLRSRKKPETTVADGQNPNGSVPNGTHQLSVAIEPLGDSYSRKLRSADVPRTPKINTSIFDNIQLTPSVKTFPAVGEKLSTPIPKEPPIHHGKGKKTIETALFRMRHLVSKLYSALPSWKVLLGLLLIVAVFCLCIYMSFYKREMLHDYYYIVKGELRKMLTKKEDL